MFKEYHNWHSETIELLHTFSATTHSRTVDVFSGSGDVYFLLIMSSAFEKASQTAYILVAGIRGTPLAVSAIVRNW